MLVFLSCHLLYILSIRVICQRPRRLTVNHALLWFYIIHNHHCQNMLNQWTSSKILRALKPYKGGTTNVQGVYLKKKTSRRPQMILKDPITQDILFLNELLELTSTLYTSRFGTENGSKVFNLCIDLLLSAPCHSYTRVLKIIDIYH